MKALSIHQPYAYLVATGRKFVENRSWSHPHRGWLAIHASKTTARTAEAAHYGIDLAAMPFGAGQTARTPHLLGLRLPDPARQLGRYLPAKRGV